MPETPDKDGTRMLRCPNCSGPLEAPDPGKSSVICSFCGGTITFDRPPPAEPAPAKGTRKGPDADPALTARIVKFVVESFMKETRIDVRKDKMAMERITEASKLAASELAHVAQAEVNLPFLTADDSGPKHLLVVVTKANLGK
jgi:hypothetical protein